MRVGDGARREAHGEENDVLDVRLDVGLADALHPDRLFTEPVEDDRDVVRTEVPEHVEIELVDPEVDALAVDVEHLAEDTVAKQSAHGFDRRVVDEGVTDHERACRDLARTYDRVGVGHVTGERLFDEDVLAGGERFFGQSPVGRDRSRDANGIDGVIRHERSVVLRRADRGKALRDGGEPLRVEIGDGDDLRSRGLREGPDDVRPPVASSYDAHADGAIRHLVHLHTGMPPTLPLGG